MVVLSVILASPLVAQNQSFQAWPEVDAYFQLNSAVQSSGPLDRAALSE
jgi:hypothetical protein